MDRAEYAAWRRENDPQGRTCEFDDRPLYAKGLCWPHYKKLQKAGYVIGPPKPKSRQRAYCEQCGGPRPKSKGGPNGRLCRNCRMARICVQCNTPFIADTSSQTFCSDECRPDNYWKWWTARNPERTSEYRARKRTIKLGLDGGEAEFFHHQEIFDRDNWECGICNQPVDPNLVWPDPDSPSLDHILPLSTGGRHTRRNVRLAHLQCNTRRGAAITLDEYLRHCLTTN